MEEPIEIPEYAPVIIKLLGGVIYNEDNGKDIWNILLSNEKAVKEYFWKMGVDLKLNKVKGFAFLSQRDFGESDEDSLPRLVMKRELSYEVSLLLVILREILYEFDVDNTDSRNCFVTNGEIKERIKLFFEKRSNEVKLLRKFDSYINEVVKDGFLKVNSKDEVVKSNTQYKIQRVICDKIDSGKLEEIKQKLVGYADDN